VRGILHSGDWNKQTLWKIHGAHGRDFPHQSTTKFGLIIQLPACLHKWIFHVTTLQTIDSILTMIQWIPMEKD